MNNMIWFLSLCCLLLCFTAIAQEPVELLALEASSENAPPAVSVHLKTQHLKNVSATVLTAETWLRNNVLAYYPATNISTIIIGHNVLCNKDEHPNMGFVLPAIKNIHYSLTRWGLQNDIKVSASFSADCLDSNSETYKADVAENYIKPLLVTLKEMGSPYIVNPPNFSDEALNLLKPHFKSMKNLGVLKTDNAIVVSPRKQKPTSRKLSSIDINNMMDPIFPPRPTTIAPSHSGRGSSVPAYAASPLPPLVGTVSPPPYSLPFPPSQSPAVNPTNPPFLPHLAPMANPATPPYGPHLPPCNPSGGGGAVGAPVGGGVHNNGVWCVAKPSVPAETLQEALDYACGEGEADCEAIKPGGHCYFPDSLVAHASYAFNSYWQKTKRNGGTCGFGGTAMLINSDPSYHRCRFSLI